VLAVAIAKQAMRVDNLFILLFLLIYLIRCFQFFPVPWYPIFSVNIEAQNIEFAILVEVGHEKGRFSDVVDAILGGVLNAAQLEVAIGVLQHTTLCGVRVQVMLGGIEQTVV
jgi:hypothetical protein